MIHFGLKKRPTKKKTPLKQGCSVSCFLKSNSFGSIYSSGLEKKNVENWLLEYRFLRRFQVSYITTSFWVGDDLYAKSAMEVDIRWCCWSFVLFIGKCALLANYAEYLCIEKSTIPDENYGRSLRSIALCIHAIRDVTRLRLRSICFV